jgi:TRAP-type C4-dicarboxylate transport system permease small subunit
MADIAFESKRMDRKAVHPYTHMIAALSPVYRWSGYLAGACLVAIFVVTMAQIIGRLVGWNPLGLTSYASYLMAATVFCGLAHTFDTGSHIRIELFLSMAGGLRGFIERAGFIVSAVTAVCMSYFAWSMVYYSYIFGEISEGMDGTMLWIPQSAMAGGITLLAIAVIDRTLRLLLLGDHGLVAAPDVL